VTLKALPRLLNPLGAAFVTPELVTIVSGSFVKSLIEPALPPPTALALLKLTVPKFASGSTFPLDGASAIHSAELSA
jgi:hypothetical protein